MARNALRFRQGMLDAARDRAAELNQRGALFPWRTINGLESSAYYAAGTAQYHIDADIAHALVQYVEATGDWDYLARGAVDILVETARMWEDLGFWRENGDSHVPHPRRHRARRVHDGRQRQPLHQRHGAGQPARRRPHLPPSSGATDPEAFERMRRRVGSGGHRDRGVVAAPPRRCTCRTTHRLGIHPQDAQFLEKELWDLEITPASQRPLLLHYHPLVIYRFQVLKQADVVLALLLQGDEFTLEEKLKDFEYYDPLTTGDSTLSAVVQSIIAAEVGYGEARARVLPLGALRRPGGPAPQHARRRPRRLDRAASGAPSSSASAACATGAARYAFDPRLPEDWERLEFRITLRGLAHPRWSCGARR